MQAGDVEIGEDPRQVKDELRSAPSCTWTPKPGLPLAQFYRGHTEAPGGELVPRCRWPQYKGGTTR